MNLIFIKTHVITGVQYGSMRGLCTALHVDFHGSSSWWMNSKESSFHQRRPAFLLVKRQCNFLELDISFRLKLHTCAQPRWYIFIVIQSWLIGVNQFAHRDGPLAVQISVA